MHFHEHKTTNNIVTNFSFPLTPSNSHPANSPRPFPLSLIMSSYSARGFSSSSSSSSSSVVLNIIMNESTKNINIVALTNKTKRSKTFKRSLIQCRCKNMNKHESMVRGSSKILILNFNIGTTLKHIFSFKENSKQKMWLKTFFGRVE